MRHISFEYMNTNNSLLFDNIQTGFEQYPYTVLERTPDQYLSLLKTMVSLNGAENSYADCYFGKLPSDRQQGLLSFLPDKWQQELKQHQFTKDSIYLQFDSIDDPMIEILSCFSAQEYLFSTFYFTKYPCTLWTNYSLKYPLFFKNKETKLFYSAVITDTDK